MPALPAHEVRGNENWNNGPEKYSPDDEEVPKEKELNCFSTFSREKDPKLREEEFCPGRLMGKPPSANGTPRRGKVIRRIS